MPTVLVADDHDDCRLIYTTILQHQGFQTLSSSTGEETLELARTASPDAIVLDMHFPNASGSAIIRALRADPATRNLRILVLTADAQTNTRADAEGAGCDSFLLKPCAPHDLTDAVRAMLSDPPLPPHASCP